MSDNSGGTLKQLFEKLKEDRAKSGDKYTVISVAVGVALGLGIGALVGNIPAGLAIGAAVGMYVGMKLKRKE